MNSPPATPSVLDAGIDHVSLNIPSTPAATAPGTDHAPMISPPTPAAAAEDRANVSVNLTPPTQDSLTPSTQGSEMSMFVDEEEET